MLPPKPDPRCSRLAGSPCFHEESQISGVCKLLPYCSWAVKERRSHLYPQTCSFVGYLPVVCCPYTRTHDPPHLPLRPARPFLMPAEVAALPAPMTGALPALPLQPADVESPLLPPPLEIGGPLGPLATSSSQRPGYRPPDGPDDLQQEAEGLMVPMADRIAVAAGPAGPTGFLGNLQLGDGSAGFAVRRPK